MTLEQVRFFLDWATVRASAALLENDITPTDSIRKSLERQIMGLMAQAEFFVSGASTND